MVINDVPIIGWFGAALAVLGLLSYAIKGLRRLVRLARKMGDFLDDWQGEPARADGQERLGVLARLARVESQLVTNGGSSLKDQNNRIESTLKTLSVRFDDHVLASGDTNHPKG